MREKENFFYREILFLVKYLLMRYIWHIKNTYSRYVSIRVKMVYWN
jgi:hypothetical protein